MSGTGIEYSELSQNVRRLQGLENSTRQQIDKLMDRSLIKIDREVKIRARSGGAFSSRSTGMLARKSGWKNLGGGQGVITAGVKYGKIQEFGGTTPPHDIKLRFAKAFAFASGGGGFSNAAAISGSRKLARIGSSRIGKAMAAGKSITGMTIVSGSAGTPGIIKHPGSRIPGTHYTRDSIGVAWPSIQADAAALIASQAGGAKWP